MSIHFFELQEVVSINKDLVAKFGGLHGIRDRSLLESAVYQPQITFEQKYLYDTLFKMAACYALGLIKNHPFIDGNKRTGIAVAMLFLTIHDIQLDISDTEIFNLAIKIANSNLDINKLSAIFEKKICN